MVYSLFTFASAQEIVQKNDGNYYVETGYIPDGWEYYGAILKNVKSVKNYSEVHNF